VSYSLDVDPLAEQQIAALPFGGLGMITYLILNDQRRVDLLIVTWAG
jgi:hypothetical protein